MKKLLLFLFAILVSFTGFSQDLSQQANDCFDTGNYACAQKKYEASYLLAKTSQKQIIEIKIQTVKWCLNKLEIANNLFESKSYKSAKDTYQEILSANPKDNFSKSQVEKCDVLIEKTTIKTLSISSSNIFFTSDVSSKKIDVITNSKYYTIEKNDLPDWLSVTQHYDYVTVSCEQNKKRKSRGGVFVIKAGPNSRIVTVTQEGKIKKQKYVKPKPKKVNYVTSGLGQYTSFGIQSGAIAKNGLLFETGGLKTAGFRISLRTSQSLSEIVKGKIKGYKTEIDFGPSLRLSDRFHLNVGAGLGMTNEFSSFNPTEQLIEQDQKYFIATTGLMYRLSYTFNINIGLSFPYLNSEFYDKEFSIGISCNVL